MFSKKITKDASDKTSCISLINDFDDIKISLFFGKKSTDSWISYYSVFYIKDFSNNQFRQIFSSGTGSVNNEAQLEEFQEMHGVLAGVLQERNSKQNFSLSNGELNLEIDREEDVFRVKAAIDLCTLNSERLETGAGDSELSLSFNCSITQMESFASELENYLNS